MMGPPGAGKGTQAGRFARERGLLKISTGDILREAIKEKNPTALAAQARMDRGELVDDAMIIAIVAERLGRADAKPGFVLDGFPRTVAQARALDELMARSDNGPLIVIDVAVPEQELVRRLGSRRICRGVRDQRRSSGVDVVREVRWRTDSARRRRPGRGAGAVEDLSDVHDAGAGVLPRASDVPRRERCAAAGTCGARARHDDRRCRLGDERGACAVIVCRSQSEIAKLRRVNQLVARILAELRRSVAPGVTTRDLDTLAERLVREAGAEPAFKGYHGYPATVCASVNEQVVHGIPSTRALVDGDIVSIDMGAKLDGFFGDCAVTVPVGAISPEAERAASGDRRGAVSGDRCGETGRAGLGHRRRGAAPRRGARVFGGSGVRRARHRDVAARGAAGGELRPGRLGTAALGGHGPRDRADGERRAGRR